MPLKRQVYTYRHLLLVATDAFELARDMPQSRARHQYMHVVLYSALALEAFLNHIGVRMIPGWELMKKKLSPREKLEFIARQRKVEIDFGTRPFQSFGDAFRLRNMLAHAETEKVDIGNIDGAFNHAHENFAATTWEQFCVKYKAEIILEDVESIIERLPATLNIENEPNLLLSESVLT